MLINGQEILLPTTMVGSYPRPHWLSGRVFGEFDEPEFIDYLTKEYYEDAVKLCIKEQEDAGLDIVTDGHLYLESETSYEYGQAIHFMAHHFVGMKRFGEPVEIEPYRKFHAPIVYNKVRWNRPILEPVLEAAKSATKKPIKIACQGPLFLAFCSTDRYYSDTKSLALDIARAYNEEFKDLTRRGVDLIQINEPLTFYVENLGAKYWFVDVINTAFDGIEAYKVWHICYGNQGGTPGISKTQGNIMFPFAYDANVDQIHIELKSRGLDDLKYLKDYPKDKDLGIGTIDAKTLVAETPEEVANIIRETSKVIPLDRICVSTDCGLLNLKREQARSKLRALVEGTKIVRAEVAK
jgi:5-methyltetrahydropteroyltriglutamate--homocysteine methyltransferase